MYDKIIKVETILSPALENLNLLGRPDLKASMTKLNLWKQVQYKKVVFLDADTLVLQNIDHLFDLAVDFAAAPDIGWPDIFNSGVFLATPNMGTCAALMRLVNGGVSFDGGDQGLLNTYFSNYHRLSFTYNVTPSASYQYQPAYKHFESQLKVAHFIGERKPWTLDAGSYTGAYGQLLSRWWSVHDLHYNDPPKAAQEPKLSASAGSWDAAASPPPTAGRPQAAGLSFAGFKNTWDEPRSSAFYSPGGTRTPKSVHFERAGPIENPVFPWEGKTSSERTFPEDSKAPLQEVRTIPRDDTSTPDHEEPESIQFPNAWDAHDEIKKYMVDAGISSSKPGPPKSLYGSGTHTPQPATEGKEFKLEPSGVPESWDPSSAVDKLASHAQELAEKAAEQAGQ